MILFPTRPWGIMSSFAPRPLLLLAYEPYGPNGVRQMGGDRARGPYRQFDWTHMGYAVLF